jgi:hypothetical protein
LATGFFFFFSLLTHFHHVLLILRTIMIVARFMGKALTAEEPMVGWTGHLRERDPLRFSLHIFVGFLLLLPGRLVEPE